MTLALFVSSSIPVESEDVVEVCPENDTTEVKLETSSVSDTVNDETRGLAKKCLPELPFDALFLNNNDQDISNIIKNMEHVVYDQAEERKIAKTCNFEVKTKE